MESEDIIRKEKSMRFFLNAYIVFLIIFCIDIENLTMKKKKKK
jgi:hypothetical protein